MTLDEAIKHAKYVAEEHREKCTTGDCDRFSKCLKCAEEHEQLARWLEELQQYRAIGTVEGYEHAIESSIENYNLYREYKEKVQEYRTIGTVEECRVAVDKQKPKKPIYDKPIGVLECPCCGNYLQKGVDDEGSTEGFIPNHCSNCGQNIDADWSDL